MEKSDIALDAERHELYKSETNEPVILDGSLLIRDKITDVVMMIPNTIKTRQFFNVNTINKNLKSCNINIVPSVSSATDGSTEEPIELNNLDICDTQSLSSLNSTPLKWTDSNAVRALISKWKNHESDFKNTQIRNNKVWQMIAEELKKENPLWNFNSIQCENKFKDVRKSYTKVKDHNNQSGAELKTYKFYEEMEAVLGDKPIIKPISIASTLMKRTCPKRAVSPYSSDSEEKENSSQPKQKRSKIAKEFDKWSVQHKMETKEREEARMQRHKEKMERQDKAIAVYKEQMEKLLEKL